MASCGAVISIFLCVEFKGAQEENVATRIIAGVGYKSALNLSVYMRARVCVCARDCVAKSALDLFMCVCVCVPGCARTETGAVLKLRSCGLASLHILFGGRCRSFERVEVGRG